MKSYQVLGWVLGNVSLLAACGGVSSIGSGAGAGDAGMGGAKTAGAPGTIIDPKGGSDGEAAGNLGTSVGGKPSGEIPGGETPGSGATTSVDKCQADSDCLGVGDLCQPCANGGFSCNSYCVAGQCLAKPGSCPAECSTNADCTAHGQTCIDCGGDKVCSQSSCQMGVCQTSKPVCGLAESCTGLQCGAQCRLCADDAACDTVIGFCNEGGKCQPDPPTCTAPGTCQTAMDCGSAPPNCTLCTSGGCAAFDCVGSKCLLTCPSSTLQCKYAEECQALSDGQCTMCPNGKCAVPACLQNACELVCPVQ